MTTKKTRKSSYGWHWVRTNAQGRPILRDNRPVPPDGEWLVHDGLVKMCWIGLHFSRRILDALGNAPGTVLCRVEVEGVVEEGTEKGVCRLRKVVRHADMLWPLVEFAEACATRATAINADSRAASRVRNASHYASIDAAYNNSYDVAYDAYSSASEAGRTAYISYDACDYAYDAELAWQESTLLLWSQCYGLVE